MADIYPLVSNVKSYARDLFERVLWTFLEGFVAGLVMTELTSLSMWQAAAVGGVAAVGALLKGVVAKTVGDANSASLSRKV